MPSYRLCVIVPHPIEPRLLLLPGPDGWVLPFVHDPSEDRWHARAIARALRREWQIEVTVRRWLSVHVPPVAPTLTYVYLLETHTPEWDPPESARWVSRQELDVLPLARAEQRTVIEDWFSWEAAPPHPLRVDWYRVGWYAEATRWIGEQLAALDRHPLGPPEQLRSWQRSCVIRQDTLEGAVYFKAVPSFFAHEPTLTDLLHRRFPTLTPTVLALHETEPWMLLADVGGQTLADVPDLALYERALALYAQMQVELAGDVERLLAAGCPRCELADLVVGLNGLLTERSALFCDEPRGLSSEQIAALERQVPRLEAVVAELANVGLPTTLDHGDLWPMQIAVRHEEPVFMDWSDASITHPFISPGFFTTLNDPIFLRIEIAGRYLASRLPEARARCLDAYLEPWTTYAHLPALRRAYAQAQQLAGVHYALLYWRRILPGMEIKGEMENMIPFHLRRALDAIGAG